MRLFVAINLPAFVRQRLFACLEPLRQADLPVRWTEPESLHVTLKFLGRVEQGRRGEILDALRDALSGAPPFQLELHGLGVFPSATRPRVFWIAVQPTARLSALYGAVEEQLAGVGFPAESRSFSPHLTIGRARSGAAPAALRGWSSAARGLTCAERVDVSTVELMRSHLSRRGARYEELASIPLGGEGTRADWERIGAGREGEGAPAEGNGAGAEARPDPHTAAGT